MRMPNVVHEYLDTARDNLKNLGLTDDQIVNTTLGDNSVVIIESDWIVLTQTPAAGAVLPDGGSVHLGVVKLTDPKAAGITPKS